MKKTLIALMAMAGVAMAELGSTTYTWVTAGDGTTENPSVGATTSVLPGGTIPTFPGYSGVTATTGNYGYLSSYKYCETGSDVLHEAITQSLAPIVTGQTEAVSLTLNFSFAFGSTSKGNTTTLLQIGAKDTGLGINLYNQHVYITLGGVNTYDLGTVTVSSGTNGNRMNDVAITLSNGTYTATITEPSGNTTATKTVTGVLTNEDITWDHESARVAIGMIASGWLGNDFTSNGGVLLKSASATVTTYALPVPEPTTATLSLLALAGLAARRRRH